MNQLTQVNEVDIEALRAENATLRQQRAEFKRKIKLLLTENHGLRQQLGAMMLAVDFIRQHGQEVVNVCDQLEKRLETKEQQNGDT